MPGGDHDHDSTCVYVADEPEMTVPISTAADDARVIAQIAIVDDVAEIVAVSTLIRPEWAHAPPDSLAAPRDLYLKLRTLRI